MHRDTLTVYAVGREQWPYCSHDTDLENGTRRRSCLQSVIEPLLGRNNNSRRVYLFWRVGEVLKEELWPVRWVSGRSDPQQVLQTDRHQRQPHSDRGERRRRRQSLRTAEELDAEAGTEGRHQQPAGRSAQSGPAPLGGEHRLRGPQEGLLQARRRAVKDATKRTWLRLHFATAEQLQEASRFEEKKEKKGESGSGFETFSPEGAKIIQATAASLKLFFSELCKVCGCVSTHLVLLPDPKTLPGGNTLVCWSGIS